MSLRAWSIKPSELKKLDTQARVKLLVRWTKRVEPWIPKSAVKKYREALVLIEAGGHDSALADELEDLGATACNLLDGTDDEALGYCHDYATLVIAGALRPTTTKELVEIAKYIGSIPAVLAHAGKVKESVEVAAPRMWAALRSDIRD